MLMSPLLGAAAVGNAKELNALLLGGAATDERDDYGNTALHHAAKAGSRDCIVALVRAGADVNATEQRMRWTPLHVAAYNGKDTCTPALVAAGAQLDAADVDGRTPWMLASKSGKEELGRLLKYVKAVREERGAVGCWADQGQVQEEGAQRELAALAQRAAQLEHECARLAERAAAAERERDEARMQAQTLGQRLAAVQAADASAGGLAMPPGLPEAVGALQRELASVLMRLAAVEEALNASGTPELRDNKRGMLSP